jgi:limonene-1,2-epoxide hydrolase
MSEQARQNAIAYFTNHDASQLADNVVFRMMGTGQEYHGREQVGQALDYFYHVVFNAKAETHNIIFGEKNVTVEADIVGRQMLEIAGIPPAPGDREVRIPFCGVYDLENDRIVRARIYLQFDVLRAS